MYTLNYYPWLYQQVKRFAALEAANARVADVTVAPSIDVPEQFDIILIGDAQIGLMNSVGFAFARRRNGISRRLRQCNGSSTERGNDGVIIDLVWQPGFEDAHENRRH
ncbi:hypothetical protein GOC94_10105 [Sinorhizobium medicae]|nr:hypothetical protein [Sinorhizobium medicae]